MVLRWALALGLGIAAAAGHVALRAHLVVPELPAVVWGGTAGIALALAGSLRSRWALCAVAPLVLLSVAEGLRGQGVPLDAQLHGMALDLAWASTVAPLVAAVWVGGVSPRGFPLYAGRVGLATLAVQLGLQILLPGLALFLLLALIEVSAARPPYRLRDVVATSLHHPDAWVVAALSTAAAAGLGVAVGFTGGLDVGLRSVLSPVPEETPLAYASAVVHAVVRGGGLGLAAFLFDRRAPSAPGGSPS